MQNVTTAYIVPIKDDVELDMFISNDELHFGVVDLRKGYHRYYRRALSAVGSILNDLLKCLSVSITLSDHVTLKLFWEDGTLKFHYTDVESNYKLHGKMM